MEITVKTFVGGEETIYLKSKTELTPEKVYNLLSDEHLIFIPFDKFIEDIWTLLLQNISIYKPKQYLCSFVPHLDQ